MSAGCGKLIGKEATEYIEGTTPCDVCGKPRKEMVCCTIGCPEHEKEFVEEHATNRSKFGVNDVRFKPPDLMKYPEMTLVFKDEESFNAYRKWLYEKPDSKEESDEN